MIFPSVKMDSLSQVDDRFRIDFEGSTTHDGTELTSIEVIHDPLQAALTVFKPSLNKNNMFLDWQFGVAGVKQVTVIFYAGADTKQVLKTIKVLTQAEEKLFSSDEMLIQRESNILSLLPAGRSSFIYMHRLAQKEILKDLEKMGYGDLLPANLLKIEDVQEWSTLKVLALIFESNITSIQDVHTQKRLTYANLALEAKNRSVVKLDLDANGTEDVKVQTFPTHLVRR